MIFGVFPSITATAELVVPVDLLSAMAVTYKVKLVQFYIPRSIPMTWPLTFSSPSVEFHLRKEAPGTLKAGVRAKEAVRGSCT